MIEKICHKCCISKKSDDFYRRAGSKDGLYGTCKECRLKCGERWAKNNKEKVAEIKKRWQEKNKEKVNESNRIWRDKNKEKMGEIRERWIENNRGRIAETRQRWNENNRVKRQIGNHVQNNYRRRAENPPTKEQLNRLIEESNNICFWCDCDIPKGEMHLDHIYPLSKNGTHDIHNLVISCKSCNLRKHNKAPEVFLEQVLAEKSINS